MVLIPVLIVVALCYLIYYILSKDLNYWEKRNVRGPKPALFFGNLKESVLRRQPVPVVFKQIYDDYPNEKVVGVFRMKTPAILIRDPELIKHVTIKDFDNFVDRGMEFSKEGLGANLFHSDGETWRVLRNKFTPMFTSGKLKNMLYLIDKRGDLLLENLKDLIESNPEQEVKSIIQKYTISSISATAFGFDLEYDNKQLFKQLSDIDELIFNNNYALELDMMFPGILKKFNGSLFPKSLNAFFRDMVKRAVTARNGMPTNRNDFMDLMLGMKQAGVVKRKLEDGEMSLEITDSIMAAQAFVFYGAGYETSATTMTFMLYQLATNQDIQDKLIAHVDEVLARHDGKTTYECLSDLDYMTWVFEETLRMYPIVDPLQRNALKDYKIPGTDIIIKKGQTVLISANGIHYDEKYYPNPEKFDPERFSPKNSKDRHPCVYLPFGIGPRNCIGARFAYVQSKVFLAKFFSKYRVELSSKTNVPLKYDGNKLLLNSLGGMPLKIVPRK